MTFSLFYIPLAILGLGLLVFIHELGHYWIARRNGMRVEVFAIGFGKPIYSWQWQGVKWQICMLPFGGYVKIAGMQKEGSREPYEIADGFYGKRPWQRIQVALAGPAVNIAFALVAFSLLWVSGGRQKQFYEFTHRIGWVDPKSVLYANGVRPGDVIEKYDGKAFHGFRDLLMAAVMSEDKLEIEGYKIDYQSGQRNNFNYTLQTYEDPAFANTRDKLRTIGVLSPARYLIFAGDLPAGSPMVSSGIEPNDRVLWADGEVLFSAQQLSSLINESTAFLTVQRGDRLFQTKVPRIQINDLKMSAYEKGELDDWQHEVELKGRLQDLYYIPYNISPTAAIESRLHFIDEQDQTRAFQKCQRCAYFTPLEEGDQILAIDGKPIQTAPDLLKELQTRHVLVIVGRDPVATSQILWSKADEQFDAFKPADLEALISSIGTKKTLSASGSLHLLKPIVPTSFNLLPLTDEGRAKLAQELTQMKKEIEAIQDPQKRKEAFLELEKSQRKAILGLPLKDRNVIYNPTPQQQFLDVVENTWRTLSGLVSGYVNPKYVQGPVGIVQVIHQSWMIGAKEALFWMALISLNLGLINLLPVPFLDGGHVVFSLVEMVTKRPIRSKTMERLIIPFVVVLIGFFLFITYHDIIRLFSRFF